MCSFVLTECCGKTAFGTKQATNSRHVDRTKLDRLLLGHIVLQPLSGLHLAIFHLRPVSLICGSKCREACKNTSPFLFPKSVFNQPPLLPSKKKFETCIAFLRACCNFICFRGPEQQAEKKTKEQEEGKRDNGTTNADHLSVHVSVPRHRPPLPWWSCIAIWKARCTYQCSLEPLMRQGDVLI